MSEVQSRPSAPRGRGSRGGRGGFSSRGGRGGRGGHATNGDKQHADEETSASPEDEGEIGQLKKKYGENVGFIKELFPGWTDEDVVLALKETDGDLETTIDRISNGSITQWGEVSKTKKDRSKSKVKEGAPLGDASNQQRVSRGDRGGRGGVDGGRGGRGRGADRGSRGGGRGGRGASAAHTNGSRKDNDESLPPATESTAWDNPAASWDTPAATNDTPSWDAQPAAESSAWDSPAPAAQSVTKIAAQAASNIIPDGVKKSWAALFVPAPPPPKQAPEPVVEKDEDHAKPEVPVEAAKEVEVVESARTPVEEIATTPLQEKIEPVVITPSKDALTETNLEQVLDTSGPAPSATAASTAASSWDPRNATINSTPQSATQATAQAVRPPTSGFQASALKATGSSGRTPSYQRRVLDQEEAVRMPGNREVDRAAVQFGAFNLGSGEEDVDGDREEAETRAQPPQHSPIAPRAALPPAPQQVASPAETLPTPKQAPGLPAATHPPAAPGLPSPAPAQSAAGAGPQNIGQFNRYGQSIGSHEGSSLPQKPYDAFSQQGLPGQSPFEGYGNPQQSQTQQPSSGAPSSTPGDFSSYYTANEQQRQAYSNYYQQQYGPQGQQEGPASQQRSFSGYGPQSEGTTPFSQSGAQQAPSRYATAGEGQNSGHNTPNPAAQTQQHTGQSGQQQPGHPQQSQAGGYPYGHPYYSSPYYAAYMNQYQTYPGNYGNAPYGGKGAGHQQPYQGYGMSPGAPYDHATTPSGGAFGGASSLHGRDSALAGGLGDYGRAGSQTSQNQQGGGLGGNNNFGAHDTFGRNSSYQGQGGYNAQQGNQQGSTDDLKPFGESKTGNGPSPSLAHAGRPGSATNTAPGSGLPPPQSQQSSYGGYPHAQQQQQQGHGAHGNQANSQYSSLGGAGGHQAGQGHQNSPYAGYGGFGGGYGGGYGNTQQQRGGWGGNYGH